MGRNEERTKVNRIVKLEKYEEKFYLGIIVIGMIALTLILSMHLTLAAGSDPWALIQSFLGNTFNQIMSLVTGVTIFLILIALFTRMVSNNPQSKAAATNWIIGILVCWFFIVTLGAWFNWIAPQFENNDYEFVETGIVEMQKM